MYFLQHALRVTECYYNSIFLLPSLFLVLEKNYAQVLTDG